MEYDILHSIAYSYHVLCTMLLNFLIKLCKYSKLRKWSA